MQHQDFNTIIFNSGNNNISEKKKEKKEGKTPLMSDNDTIKIEPGLCNNYICTKNKIH